MTSKGGPITNKGKLASSKNSLKHGLNAKQWLNKDEQEAYNFILAGLAADYKPVGTLEEILIERIAACQTRLERIHRVEDAAFHLSRGKSNDTESFIREYGIENTKIVEELSAMLIGGHKSMDEELNSSLARELWEVSGYEITGWQFICSEMPAIKNHIVQAAIKEGLSIDEYLAPYGRKSGELPKVRLIFQSAGEDEPPISEEELENSGNKVPDSTLQNYVEHLLQKAGKNEVFKEIAFAYIRNMEQRRNAATPNKEELDKIHRARTSDERLLSRSIGELLELQERRFRKERQQSKS
jgi:hypothetical protein